MLITTNVLQLCFLPIELGLVVVSATGRRVAHRMVALVQHHQFPSTVGLSFKSGVRKLRTLDLVLPSYVCVSVICSFNDVKWLVGFIE